MRLFLLSICTFLFSASFVSADPEVVKEVDLEKYQGVWYEIARLPNRFQKQCVAQATAIYTLRPDGKIEVVNKCPERSGISEASGLAWRPDPNVQGKLKVSFIPLLKYLKLFGGDYWVLELASDYSYVMVGDPSLGYLWILSRQKMLGKKVTTRLLKKAKLLGFKTEQVIFPKALP